MKKLILMVFAVSLVLVGCSRESDVASENISKEADEFRVRRRIVFMNTMTDTYLFSVEGNCSITADMEDEQLEVTCKIGDNSYQKHFFGLSPTVTYTVEQLEWIEVDKYKYELIFKPEQIIPITIDVE
ncbi:hypothetical protein [Breznakia pachnodae]|uniref:Lipoprotein n=1 Tax=Breznakia pachnodae TaxID=265178 RepID=A0ABU0E481_9FIRM|nr:hypothetical protein [Breznakia pachnodae]MDQ0361631.1 hypothetical protein [Breznakia pachnodae]